MKIGVLLSILLCAVHFVSAAEFTAKTGEWIFIPVSMPEAKIGGGDFYNLQLETVVADSSIEYTLQSDGIRLKSEKAGFYDFRLIVNHVTKSSCASVEVDQYRDDKIQLHVVD